VGDQHSNLLDVVAVRPIEVTLDERVEVDADVAAGDLDLDAVGVARHPGPAGFGDPHIRACGVADHRRRGEG
jgi:hypothetical protein